ncbi:hypothetical protein CRUP_028568 [Coryphaenoides rupestris]|nr:hypothetical protein CRUP_028568 [Coryphaenoides rupestris]
MDLNEISMNLVPFPRLHYVVPSLTPLCSNIPHRRLDHMFSEVFSKDNQLIRADPKRSGLGLLPPRLEASAVTPETDKLLTLARISTSDWRE